MLRTRSLIFVLAVLPCVWPSTARAQSDDEKSTARALGNEGQDALDKKDFARAADRFHRAVAIFEEAKAPTIPPTLLLGLARADTNIGRLVSATEAYNRIIRQGAAANAPQVFIDAMNDAKREIEAVSPRIASVTVNVTGCDSPQVTIDDKPLSSAMIGVKKPIDPGTHAVKVTAVGCDPGESSFTVADGKSGDVSVALVKAKVAATPPPTTNNPPTTPPPPTDTPPPQSGSSMKTYAYISLGVGVVGLGLGAITGGIAIGKYNALAKDCPNGSSCPPGQPPPGDLDSYHTMGALSTVGFIVGGIGAAAGVTLFVLAPSGSPKNSAWISPVIGPGSIGAVGRF